MPRANGSGSVARSRDSYVLNACAITPYCSVTRWISTSWKPFSSRNGPAFSAYWSGVITCRTYVVPSGRPTGFSVAPGAKSERKRSQSRATPASPEMTS